MTLKKTCVPIAVTPRACARLRARRAAAGHLVFDSAHSRRTWPPQSLRAPRTFPRTLRTPTSIHEFQAPWECARVIRGGGLGELGCFININVSRFLEEYQALVKVGREEANNLLLYRLTCCYLSVAHANGSSLGGLSTCDDFFRTVWRTLISASR